MCYIFNVLKKYYYQWHKKTLVYIILWIELKLKRFLIRSRNIYTVCVCVCNNTRTHLTVIGPNEKFCIRIYSGRVPMSIARVQRFTIKIVLYKRASRQLCQSSLLWSSVKCELSGQPELILKNGLSKIKKKKEREKKETWRQSRLRSIERLLMLH